MSDRIHIKELLLPTVIGVPAEERESPQTVRVNLVLSLRQSFRGVEDDLSRTIDYYEVTQVLKKSRVVWRAQAD